MSEPKKLIDVIEGMRDAVVNRMVIGKGRVHQLNRDNPDLWDGQVFSLINYLLPELGIAHALGQAIKDIAEFEKTRQAIKLIDAIAYLTVAWEISKPPEGIGSSFPVENPPKWGDL